ncbi:NAD-dependent DNA ligase LigA [Spirochaeta dissipatitropha]
MQDIIREIDELVKSINEYDRAYYQQGRSLVSDLEYDRLFDRLRSLEMQHPELQRPDSPSQRVGSDLSNELPEVEHSLPVLSLDKVYSAADLQSWYVRIASRFRDQPADLICEEKMDGVSIVLYYEGGVLQRALTRGNGRIGNDVSHNIRTIRSIPLRITDTASLAVRGEVYIQKDDFEQLNRSLETPFANPRNLAAGTIRRVKSSGAARVPLRFFAYEIFGLENVRSHHEALIKMHEMGFPVNDRCVWVHQNAAGKTLLTERFSALFPGSMVGSEDMLSSYIAREIDQRQQLPYEIDGLVAKIDAIGQREELGYTGHHPRWAVALKFDAPQGISRVLGIDVQVGRTGRITPVARIEAVEIGGSTVQNVTLHNQEYITGLELNVGDTVAVSKRGDVIPAVEQVLEKSGDGHPVWEFPDTCPSCGSILELRGAHHFCPDTANCPEQQRGRLRFFTSRGQMDIDGLGSETLDTLIRLGFVRDISDLYVVDYNQLQNEPGFGDKKISQLKDSIRRSLEAPYRQVLPSLGIPEIGPKLTQILCDAGYHSIDDLYRIADENRSAELSQIHGIGERTAKTVVEQLKDSSLRLLIQRLRDAGLQFSEDPQTETADAQGPFEGQVWCVTGSFENFNPRSMAVREIEQRGGTVTGSVSGKTTHLLAGSGAGSKYDKAVSLGVVILDEQEFLGLLDESETSE